MLSLSLFCVTTWFMTAHIGRQPHRARHTKHEKTFNEVRAEQSRKDCKKFEVKGKSPQLPPWSQPGEWLRGPGKTALGMSEFAGMVLFQANGLFHPVCLARSV